MVSAFDEALENPETAPQVKLSADDVDVGNLRDSDDSSSSSSDDESSDDNDEDDVRGVSQNAEIEDEDEDDNNGVAIRSKHEIVEEPVPDLPEHYSIPESATISPIGKIKNAFDNNIIIEGVTSGEKRVLKEGSILCLEDRTAVGIVCEVFGPLRRPFYRVTLPESKRNRFEEVKEHFGSDVFVVVLDAHWIDTFELKKLRGTDASNGYDEELPEEEQEFSDDEKEAMFKKRKREQHKMKKENGKSKQPRTGSLNRNTNPMNLPSMKVPQAMSSVSVSYRSRESRKTPRQDSPAAHEQPHSPHEPQHPIPQSASQFTPGFYQNPHVPPAYGMPYAQQLPSFQPFLPVYPQPQPLYQGPVYYSPQPQPQQHIQLPAATSAPAAPVQQNMQQVLQLHHLLVQQHRQQQQNQDQTFNYDNKKDY